ncbi:MAG: glycoside hydrolase family 127 protein [Tepidisphaeraceae bacterium]
MPRSALLTAVLATLASSSLIAHAESPALPPPNAIVVNRPPLERTPFVRLPIGAVKPEGWLRRQLDLQKTGLTGAAEKLYDALTPDSAWLGGKGENWEKGPYYVKGLIALAHTIDDQELKDRAQKWIDWTLKSQQSDGQFGPPNNDDWWPRMVVLFYLRDHYEATGDARVLPFLLNYFRFQLNTMPGRPMREWGRARAGDNLDIVLWTYNLTGEPFLLDLAKVLNDQAYPWTSIFSDSRFYDFGEDFHPHHIVNVSQALKLPPIAWQFTHNAADRDTYQRGVTNMNERYGRIDGQVSGTEMLSGRASTDGVELCADVERIISSGIAVDILGDATIADQMEKVAYNSLPAHTSAELKQITYYQLPNQVAAVHGGHGFTQDYPNGNLPGPHSGFPCCCYNWHAGWPKFVQNMWAATDDGGLALVAYGPNRVTTKVRGDATVRIVQTTDYPFKSGVALDVTIDKPTTFPLALRIPQWCANVEIRVNGQRLDGVTPGQFLRVEREWKTGDKVELNFTMAVRTSTWANGSVGLERGPLAMTLKVGEDWKSIHNFSGFDEFEIRPTTAWNYALQIDRAAPNVQVIEHDVPAVPFASDAPAVVLKVPARQVDSWHVKPARGKVVLGKSDQGWRALAEATAPLSTEGPQKLRVVGKGPSLRVFVNDMDQAVLEHNDGSFATGAVGLRSYDGNATFDDVRVNGKLVADFEKPTAPNAWHTVSGEWSLENGGFHVKPTRDAKALLQAPTNLRDFTLEATIVLKPGGDAGLLFRTTDVNAKLDGYRGYYVGLSASGSAIDSEEPPVSPVTSTAPLTEVELVPFGATKLRVSYFPVLKE